MERCKWLSPFFFLNCIMYSQREKSKESGKKTESSFVFFFILCSSPNCKFNSISSLCTISDFHSLFHHKMEKRERKKNYLFHFLTFTSISDVLENRFNFIASFFVVVAIAIIAFGMLSMLRSDSNKIIRKW